ncbi:YdeI/OmpD-associated family protein [Patescibacteria group bacterium]|nr:YdeI/OmpD-associated family protein [Patescibacteria group bacterium]
MTKDSVLHGTVHTTPADMKKALTSSKAGLKAWQSLTPLARNEWICWTIFVKNKATREAHIKRMIVELREGVRRPCCWLGCIHRKDKAISPSVAAILKKKRT